jgi:hypothetical protein
VRLVAATTEAPFRSGRGACAIDTYTTTTNASYREISPSARCGGSFELTGLTDQLDLGNERAAALLNHPAAPITS